MCMYTLDVCILYVSYMYNVFLYNIALYMCAVYVCTHVEWYLCSMHIWKQVFVCVYNMIICIKHVFKYIWYVCMYYMYTHNVYKQCLGD